VNIASPATPAAAPKLCANVHSPCLFDIQDDVLEKVNLAANLSTPNGSITNATIAAVLKAMRARIEYHVKRSYPLDIDHTNYTAAQVSVGFSAASQCRQRPRSIN
jgi:hypothetical protein